MKFDQFWVGSKGLFIAIFLPFLACFLFPTINSTQDAWGFAADARWGTDLFQAHHLFYTVQLFLVTKLLPFYDVLLLGKHLNALYFGGSLFLLSKIASRYTNDTLKVNSIVFFVGSSFAALRFATENETYIAPIFYTLIGTLFLILNEKKPSTSNLIFSGFFMAFACLFHQIQFFWWLCSLFYLFFSLKNIKYRSIFYFVLPALLVPLIYSLVLVYYKAQNLDFQNSIQFVFESFYKGTSTVLFDLKGVLRFFIAILRTFIQVHGSIMLVLDEYKFLFVVSLFLGSCLIYQIVKLIKTFKRTSAFNQPHFYLYLVIIFVYLAFGLFCYGNSEMMVVIPFALGLFWISNIDFSPYHLILISGLLFAWNLIFGLVLNNQMEFSGNRYWAEKIIQSDQNVYFMRYKTEINNIIYYNKGNYSSNLYFPNCDVPTTLEAKIDSLIVADVNVYTDFVDKGQLQNSTSLIFDEECQTFFKKYKNTRVDSISILSRFEKLYKLELDE